MKRKAAEVSQNQGGEVGTRWLLLLILSVLSVDRGHVELEI